MPQHPQASRAATARAAESDARGNPFNNLTVRFEAGQPVFSEGDAGKSMYVVQSGKILLFRDVDGHKQAIGEMEKGDFFGEMSILEGLPRTISAEAVEDSELVEIHSTTFDKMIRGNIEIAIRMLRKLSIRLREAERSLAEVRAGGVVTPAAPQTTNVAAPKVRPAVNGARLEAEDGTAFALAAGETLIGRYDPVTELCPDIDLSELDLKRTVSRRHARIVATEDGYCVIEEVGALNGTSVNQAGLVPGQAHRLADGDRLTVGKVKLVFHT